MKILITGASGFIGSFIVEEALKRGMETWAAMRATSSKKFLKDDRIHFIELNLDDQTELENQLRGHQFDYVVHAAGVTKCLNKDDFYRINTEGTKHLVSALLALKMPLQRFVYVSSLSIFGAIREQQPYEEIREDDTPQPNTHYGKSKLLAEQWLDEINKGEGTAFPYVVLRPTGVYGARLFPHGEEHQAALRLRRRLQTTGHHLRLRAGRGAGRLPGLRAGADGP